MKRLILVGLLAALCGAASSAYAATGTISGTSSWGHPLQVPFTTSTFGTVTVSTHWIAKSNVRYSLVVRHLTNPDDIMSYDQICQSYENLAGKYITTSYPNDGTITGSYVLGDASCSFANGVTGYWVATFEPISGGKLPVSMTISTP